MRRLVSGQLVFECEIHHVALVGTPRFGPCDSCPDGMFSISYGDMSCPAEASAIWAPGQEGCKRSWRVWMDES